KKALVLVELLRPADHFHSPVLIFEPEQREAVPLLRSLRRQIDNDSSQRDMIPMRRLLYVTVVEPRQPLDRLGVILQRMAAGIESQRFFLESQTLFLAPGGNGRKRRLFNSRAHRVGEQTRLPGELVALRSRAILNRLVQNGHHRSPVRGVAVESAGFY